ncbi:conserved hypothetical protein [Roseibium sp. TrichSKD4]|nr:conserved hypothetical protein [Roseibium sp. TrichSKD4]
MELDIDNGPALDLAARLKRPRLNWALRSAINATLKNVTTRSAKDIREKSGIPSKKVKASLRPRKATNGNLSATLTGYGKPLSLKEFKTRRTKAGVVAKIWGDKQTFKKAFAAPSLGEHIFQRVGKKRLPIKKLYGPGVAQTMGRPDVMEGLEDFANERLRTNALRELDRAVNGKKG